MGSSGRAYFSEPTGYALFDLNGVALNRGLNPQFVILDQLPAGL